MAKKTLQNNHKVLGLDVSTKTIGWALFDMRTQELLELTHVSPRPKIKTENKIEELLSKADVFKSKLEEYKNLGITKVIIEEPLLNSNNIYTVQTLLRYNSFVTKNIYDVLGLVPEFISTYNSRKFAFPQLLQLNDKGRWFYLVDFQRTLIRNKSFGTWLQNVNHRLLGSIQGTTHLRKKTLTKRMRTVQFLGL